MTITLEEIKEAQTKVTQMIAAFERQASLALPITVTMPKLNPGEKWVGVVISADGSKKEHIILLPGEKESVNWQQAAEWAESIGGELPDRTEGALLFATMKGEFQESWYWLRERHVSDSGYAWYQGFGNGGQGYNGTSYIRARPSRPQIAYFVIQ